MTLDREPIDLNGPIPTYGNPGKLIKSATAGWGSLGRHECAECDVTTRESVCFICGGEL